MALKLGRPVGRGGIARGGGIRLDVVAQERIRNADLEERIFRQLAEDSVEQRARGLPTPALIVWGAQDRVLHPGSAGILNMLLTRSEVVLMQGVGHLPMFEKEAEFVQVIQEFALA